MEHEPPDEPGPMQPPPGLLGLLRGVLYLWGQQPLLWLLLFALPGAAAALAAPRHAWAAALLWSAALGVGAAAALMGMAGQWVHARPFAQPWPAAPDRLGRALASAVPYLFLTVGLFAALLAGRTPFPADALLLGVLLLTSPLHALAAPALLLSVTDGPSGLGALRRVPVLAGRRTWLHLALLLAVEGLVGLCLLGLGWGLLLSIGATGEAVRQVVQVVLLSAGGSLWAAAVTVSGLDALALAAEAGDEELPDPSAAGPPAAEVSPAAAR